MWETSSVVGALVIVTVIAAGARQIARFGGGPGRLSGIGPARRCESAVPRRIKYRRKRIGRLSDRHIHHVLCFCAAFRVHISFRVCTVAMHLTICPKQLQMPYRDDRLDRQ